MGVYDIFAFLMSVIKNEYGVFGLMANLYAESGLVSNNLQNYYQSRLGFTDEGYTKAVDDGSYTNFVHDSAGYGLAQWTYWSRKQSLLTFIHSLGVSIGDCKGQLQFLVNELQTNYKSVWTQLVNATSLYDATVAVLVDYEKPADQSESAKQKRSSYAQKYYDLYHGTYIEDETESADESESDCPYKVGSVYTTQVDRLRVRVSAGTNSTQKSYNELSADGKKHAYSDTGSLKKGTQVSCLGYQYVGDDVWVKIPSGWCAGYYQGEWFIH